MSSDSERCERHCEGINTYRAGNIACTWQTPALHVRPMPSNTAMTAVAVIHPHPTPTIDPASLGMPRAQTQQRPDHEQNHARVSPSVSATPENHQGPMDKIKHTKAMPIRQIAKPD